MTAREPAALAFDVARIRKDFPNERYWRDLQVGLSHICNVAENVYTGWSTDDLGDEASPALFV